MYGSDRVIVSECKDKDCPGLFSLKAVRKGDIVWTVKMSELRNQVFDNIERFTTYINKLSHQDACQVLAHAVPGIDGKIYSVSMKSFLSYVNHSDDPTIISSNLVELLSNLNLITFDIIAAKDINEMDELTVDYNQSVGYDTRKDKTMIQFNKLCEKFGVEKRPSTFRIKSKL